MSHPLEIEGLCIADAEGRRIVDGMDLFVEQGGVTALVGESGSGKTMTAMGVLGLLPAGLSQQAGTIRVLGTDIAQDPTTHRSMLGRVVSMVFQEPMTALNPVMRVDAQLLEARRRVVECRGAAARAWVQQALEAVGLEEPVRVAGSYPHELSGGMRQRVLIAMGLAPEPALLLADEPTTALDAIHRNEVLDLLSAAGSRSAGVLLITHDLASVRRCADQVAVMRGGRICEQGTVADVLGNPQHPYTQGLLACVPHAGTRDALPEIPPIAECQ